MGTFRLDLPSAPCALLQLGSASTAHTHVSGTCNLLGTCTHILWRPVRLGYCSSPRAGACAYLHVCAVLVYLVCVWFILPTCFHGSKARLHPTTYAAAEEEEEEAPCALVLARVAGACRCAPHSINTLTYQAWHAILQPLAMPTWRHWATVSTT